MPNSKSLVPEIGNALLTALFAPQCAVCSAILDTPVEGCVCRNCWKAIRPITPPICDRCGDPLVRPAEVCTFCNGRQFVIQRSRAIGEYEGALREIIHALKYSARVSLARPLAELMRRRGSEVLQSVDFVVPVPLHWGREYRRGFNQAREIARHLGTPVVDVLRRARATRPQIELAADRRHANVAGAFIVRHGWLRDPHIRAKKLLLVDDVSTTGATLESCATALKDCGAAEVYALTAARVVTRRRLGQP